MLGICIFFMIYYTDGECTQINDNRFECSVSVAVIDLYVAAVMMIIDGTLFGLFSRKYWKIISILKAQVSAAHDIPTRAWKSFQVQLFCVSTAMMACAIDGSVNYLYLDKGVDLLPLFITDVMIVSFCNGLMLKGSREALIGKIGSLKSHCERCSFSNNTDQEMSGNADIEQKNMNRTSESNAN